MNKKLVVKTILSITVIAMMTITVGCNSCGSGTEEESGVFELREADMRVLDEIRQAERIFKSLPSPLESAMLIRQAGAKFDRQFLNPVDNVSRYTTTKSMALNLGIYTCDLSFAGLYDQTQIIIEYMDAAKQMAEGLGILDAVSEEAIKRLEENINNTEVIMEVVAETFMNSSSYLEDNDQAAVAAIVLTGGWIEGLYIATQLVEMSEFDSDKLVSTIIDQKLSIDILIDLLKDHSSHATVAELIAQTEKLKSVFDKITLTSTPVKTEIDKETNVTILKSEVTSNITMETFGELRETVAEIRNSFIK